MDLKGCVVLATRGNRSIGEAFMHALNASEVHRVCVARRDATAAAHLVREHTGR